MFKRISLHLSEKLRLRITLGLVFGHVTLSNMYNSWPLAVAAVACEEKPDFHRLVEEVSASYRTGKTRPYVQRVRDQLQIDHVLDILRSVTEAWHGGGSEQRATLGPIDPVEHYSFAHTQAVSEK